MTIGMRPSKWSYRTAGSAGANIDVFAMTGGQIVLQDPRKKLDYFDYCGIGAGVGFGLKLPRIGKLEVNALGHSIAGTLAPMSWWSAGKIFMTDMFKGVELSQKDFTGACMFVEVNAGLVEGASTTAMLMGISTEAIYVIGALALTGMDLSMLIRHPKVGPKALLMMGGRNVGIQAGFGAAGYIGRVT